MDFYWLNGMIQLPWWGYIVVALALTHVTIASVTIFLHRSQAHRGLDLHPIPAHFFRFWLWMTTGMVTKEWVAIHRKHHAKCETPQDPHSPVHFGIGRVLMEGAELYRAESKNHETLEKYGHGTPDDWLERNVYSPYSWQGAAMMLVINVMLFGPIGATIWAVQMAWIPVHAAGIINGLGHFWGYRHYAVNDTSSNLTPLAFWIGGEELHNNHHAFPTSARFSMRWYEFDLGWFYIRLLESLGLAKVKKVAPRPKFDLNKVACDLETVHAVIAHRYEITSRYARTLKATCRAEIQRLRNEGVAFRDMGPRRGWSNFREWMFADRRTLAQEQQKNLDAALKASNVLETVYQLKRELASVWDRSTLSKEELVARLEDWCARAEKSGIQALENFSKRLRAYA